VLLGNELCALVESVRPRGNGKRWICHDVDPDEEEVLPLSFATLHPLFLHPLSALGADASPAIRRLAYFEVEVVGNVSVGIGTADAHWGRYDSHIGWNPVSYGYHSDDGSKWCSDETRGFSNGMDGKPYAEPYGIRNYCRHPYEDAIASEQGGRDNDVVGCGVDFDSCEVFFTLNGKMQGVAFTDVALFEGEDVVLHPCVALNESIEGTWRRTGGAGGPVGGPDRFRLNMGAEDFKFDLCSYLFKKRPLSAPDPARQHPVNEPTEDELDELDQEAGEEFDMIGQAVMYVFEELMNDEQRTAAGLGHLNAMYAVAEAQQDFGNQVPQAAMQVAELMTQEPYEDWPDWLQQHFSVSEDGHLSMLFEWDGPVETGMSEEDDDNSDSK